MSLDPIIMAIKKRRHARNLTQRQLAYNSGMSEKTYQRIEQGKADLRLSHYRAIMTALDLTELDIAMETIGCRETTEFDVLAALRLVPPKARYHLLQTILSMRN